jgi:hypothetical protein
MTALSLRNSAGGFKRRNLLQREYLVTLDRDTQTVRSVRLPFDTYDRALEHYDGLRNLRDDDEPFAEFGRTLAEHVETARAEVFENRVDAELLAARGKVERNRREGAAYARIPTAFDQNKVFHGNL